MEYILGQREPVCIFCRFPEEPERRRENLVLAITKEAFVCLNRYPFSSSHLLVVPRHHISDLAELPDDDYDALMRLVRTSAARLRRGVNAEAMNIGFNIGKAAGAGIDDHLHAHVVPRWSGDTNFMPVLGDVRVMPEYLDASWARLAPLFEDLA